ncbi:hypothetical protein M3666_07200 [Curtobacterium sp. ODYSSEY 48 V2]|uniref:hypothetical protein n=1 Tax=Curtobacterium sp. ODYSSEY 48 V2 TaxID=2939561 RepID=UPI0020401276|nr:hypothetical protein [Curtobacterium sp. ODYSSEY 48 V2]MCM3504895.1 hypothetical protein [Curtobacterium sp. ODYSSEY 48 V2]
MNVDWIGALIGAAVGAILTSGGGYFAYLIERRRVERNALRELARNLSERRAFRIDRPLEIPDARSSPDFDRLNRSVVAAREDVRGTRLILVHGAAAQMTLTRMIQTCNNYLEQSDRAPHRYWFLAAELRDHLHEQLRQLPLDLASVPRPGDEAFLPKS